jgi:hypothetical protein
MLSQLSKTHIFTDKTLDMIVQMHVQIKVGIIQWRVLPIAQYLSVVWTPSIKQAKHRTSMRP